MSTVMISLPEDLMAELAAPLVTADRQPLAAALGEPPTQRAERLRLR